MLGDLLVQESDLKYLHNYKLVEDPQDVGDVLNALDRVDRYAFDLETTSLKWTTGNIHGIALATADREWYVTGGAAKEIIPGLSKIMADERKLLIGHNLKFDFHFMNRYDVRCTRFMDTMVGEFLSNENQSLKLKELSFVKLGLDERPPDFKDIQKIAARTMKVKRIGDVNIYNIPLSLLAPYGARDVRFNYDLAEHTEQTMRDEGMEEIYWQYEVPFLLILMDMEAAGMWVNQQAMEQVHKELQAEMEEALHKWNKITGEVNPNSHDQVAKYLYENCGYPITKYTSSGKPSVDKLALLRIKRDHDDPAVIALQKYKALDKMIGTYILSWQDKMYNGRLHGSYHQTGARTTRLSSSDPNLQNIPAHGIYGPRLRSLIGAPPGYALLVADYSQIEMRLLAHYSKDPILMDVYDKSLDIHQETADRLDIERYQAKSVNFGWIYGMQWRGLQDNIEQQGRPRPEAKQAKAWLNYYEQVYSGATRWRNRVIAYAKQLGYVTTIWGKKRRLPNIKMYDKKLRAQAERQAVNSVIQGTAANIIEDAMLTLGPKAKGFGGKMVCQVHDELVFEMPIDVTEEFAAVAKRDMEAVRETYNLRVPIVSEYDIGPDWGSANH